MVELFPHDFQVTAAGDCRRKVWLAPGGQEMHRRYPDVPSNMPMKREQKNKEQ